MSAVGDVFELKMHSSVDLVDTLNVFHYRHESGSAVGNVAHSLIESWLVTVWTPLRLVLHSAFEMLRVECVNLYDLTDYSEETAFSGYDNNGAVSTGGECAPAFVVWSFYQRRSMPPFRSGAKRFSGVPEGYMWGSIPSDTAIPLLDDVAEGLSLPAGITNGSSTGTAIPVVKRSADTSPPIANYVAQAWTFRHIGSQNTRKRYS